MARGGLSQPNASMYLACPAQCGLVVWERRGRHVHYALADKRVLKLLDLADALLLHIGPLIDACSCYRWPNLAARAARRTAR